MIQVKYFAYLKEATGVEGEMIDAAGKSVAELKKLIEAKYQLVSNLAAAMAAVNEEFAADDTVLKDGDQVAFITPVSGG